MWGPPLDAAHLLGRASDTQHELRGYVNGQPYAGAPEHLPLAPHAVIVLEYGPPFVPPPLYAFPPGE